MDEFTLISTEVLNYDPDKRLDDIWQHVFSLKCEGGAPRYPFVGKVPKPLLSFAHGNVDVERAYRENCHMLHEHSKLSITSANGLRAIRSFAERYDQDPSAVPIKLELIRAVKSHRNGIHHCRSTSSREKQTKTVTPADGVKGQHPNSNSISQKNDEQCRTSHSKRNEDKNIPRH